MGDDGAHVVRRLEVAFGRPELPGTSSNGDAQPHRQTFMLPPKSV